jgi:hypothetical protein
MTVPSAMNRSGPYNGNGVTTVFDYDFKIANENHVKVIKADAAGVETVLTIDADYAVSDVGNPAGGQVTLSAPLPTGQTLTLILSVPFTQEIDLENQGAYYAETVESALDLAVMRDQQLQEQVSRAVTIPASEDPAQLAGLVGGILRLADSADNIDAVAAIDDDVSAVAALSSQIADIPSQVSAVESARDATLAALDSFDDRYLGPKAADPVVDNDGDPLVGGALYFNTVTGTMMLYTGTTWVAAYVSGGSFLAIANNLSDIASPSTALTNLGLTANGAALVKAANYAAMKVLLAIGVADISDASVNGRSLIAAANYAAMRTLLGLAIGTDVQAYDANTMKKNADQAMSAGVTQVVVDDGTKSSGTYTPSPAGGNYRKIANNGAFTLAAPSAANSYNMEIDITNGAAAGAITFSGFVSGYPRGDAITTTNGSKFKLHISKTDAGVTCVVEALQ